MDEGFGLINGLRARLDEWIEQSDGPLRADLRAMAHYMDLTRKEPPEQLCGKMAVATAGNAPNELLNDIKWKPVMGFDL